MKRCATFLASNGEFMAFLQLEIFSYCSTRLRSLRKMGLSLSLSLSLSHPNSFTLPLSLSLTHSLKHTFSSTLISPTHEHTYKFFSHPPTHTPTQFLFLSISSSSHYFLGRICAFFGTNDRNFLPLIASFNGILFLPPSFYF